ncbi:BEND2 protein, partial [Polypterus senegalus]
MPPLIRAASPYPHLQTTAKKPPTLYLAPGLRSPSESQFLEKGTQSSRVIPIKTEECTDSELSKENPDNIPQLSDSKSKSKCKSLLASLSSQPSNSATVLIGDHKRKVRIAKSVIQKVCHKSNPRNAVRFLLRGLFTNETLTCSNVMGDAVRGLKKLDPNKIAAIRAYLGDPRRKIKIAQAIIQEANLRKRPELIARFLIKYLFTKEVLVKSNVNGIKDRGTAALDPNTIGALREYLKGRFPYLQMSEDGKDWKVCVGAINSAIRKIRYEQRLKGEF